MNPNFGSKGPHSISPDLPFTDWQNDLHLIIVTAQRHFPYLRPDLAKLIGAATRAFFGCIFYWLLRRSERVCLPPSPTPAVITSRSLPWPAYAFCWAGLLMPRARRASSSRARRTASRACRALAGLEPMPTTWSLTATRARPSAPKATWC